MKLSKIRLTHDAASKLRYLSAKTGLTPNLLCRIAFCLSLGELSIPDPNDFQEEEKEFNRYTLLGDYDALFVALLKQKCYEDGCDLSKLPEFFRAHLNRGILLLQGRVKDLSDITRLIPSPEAT